MKRQGMRVAAAVVGLALMSACVSEGRIGSSQVQPSEVLGTLEYVELGEFVRRNGGCCVVKAGAAMDSIQSTFDTHKSTFYFMYRDLLQSQGVEGEIWLAIAISSIGRVSDIGVLKNTTGSNVLAWNVVDYTKSIEFGGHHETRIVKFPMHFKGFHG